MSDVSIRNSTLNNKAGGHRAQLSKKVDCSNPMKARMLDILAHQLAIYEDCKAEINTTGTVVDTSYGLRAHPAIATAKNSADMILRYAEKLGLVNDEDEVIDEIAETIKEVA